VNFCCTAFAAAIDDRHERGLFIYVLPPADGNDGLPAFRIASRSILRSDLERVQPSGLVTAVPITLLCHTGLSYCPWCGIHLGDFYSGSYTEILDEHVISEFSAA
jgi:hypothetical protein